jgi:hypothetical protein
MPHDRSNSEPESVESSSPTLQISTPNSTNSRSEAFLATLKEAECDICGDRFNEIHVPVILKCRHVAGLHCIRGRVMSRIQSHNKCLKCKTVLFDNGTPILGERKGDHQTPPKTQLARPRQARTARMSSDSAELVQDASPVVGRFSGLHRHSSNLTQSKMPPMIPLQQQHLQRHINDLHQFVLMSSGPPEPRAHLLSLPGIPRIPRAPSSPGSPATPPVSPPPYSRNAPSLSAAQQMEDNQWLSERSRRPLIGTRTRGDSPTNDNSPYPVFTDGLPLMEYLTEAHDHIDPRPQGGVQGEWPYQYPANLQPTFDNAHDTGLHCLAQGIVARRWEVLRRRGSLPHLRCHPVQEEYHPEYDVEAVKRRLCAGMITETFVLAASNM